jgi:hypothetical protein
MDGYISQARLRPVEFTGQQLISSKKPDLWLDANRGLGTTGARFFTVVNGEYFTLATKPNPGIQNFWLSFWIKPTAVGAANYGIFYTGGNAADISGIWLYQYEDDIKASFNTVDGGAPLTTTFTDVGLVAGSWRHIVLLVNRTTKLITLVSNTVLSAVTLDISSKTGLCTPNAAAVSCIGALATPTNYFGGAISRLAYGQGTLPTTLEITELYNQGNGKFYAELSSSLAEKVVSYWNLNEAGGIAHDAKGSNNGADINTVTFTTGPRESTASDITSGYHGVLVNMDTVNAWSTDTPDNSYTNIKLDSIGSATGVMTNFSDIDIAHVDGPNGNWGPYVKNLGADGTLYDGWIISSPIDVHSKQIPDSLNTHCFDEYYTESASSGSRWFDGTSKCFIMSSAPAYGSGNFTVEEWIYPTTYTIPRTIFGKANNEVILNGGFETLGVGSPDIFANWTESTTGQSTIADGGVANADSGTRCARLITLNGIASLTQNVLIVGHTYTLSFRCKSSSNSSILLVNPSVTFNTTVSYQTFTTTFIATSSLFTLTTPIDVLITFYIDSVSCIDVFSGFQLSLYPTTGYLVCDIANSGTQVITSGTPALTAYTWHHTAAVVDRTRNRVDLWVDGALCSSGNLSTITGSITPSGSIQTIGASTSTHSTSPFIGAISRVRIAVGSAYTNADIIESYNGGKGRDYSELSAALKAKVTHNWELSETSGTAVDSKGGNNAVVSSGNITYSSSTYLPSYDGILAGYSTSSRSITDVPTPLISKCKSITFGSGKYINTNINTLSGMGARSVSLWFKIAAAPSAVETLISEAAQNLAQYGINISIAAAGGLVNAIIYKGGGATAVHPVLISSASVCDNSWHHIVYTWDGTTIANKAILYVDGSSVDTDTAIVTTQGAASTYPLNISGNNNGTLITNGSVCRPQIFAGRALTQAEVTTLFTGGDVTEGLTSEWRFSELDNIIIPFTHSMDFDGANSKIDCGHPVVNSGAMTISSWIYADGVGETAGRICDNGSTQLYLSSTTALTYSSDGTTLATTNGGFETLSWKHVAVSRDSAGRAKVFVDGKNINCTSIITANAGPISSGTTNLFIGNRNATDRTFDGKIGELKIYNSVLTQSQIRELAQGGSVGAPIGNWKFDSPISLIYLNGTKAIDFDGVKDYISLVNTDLAGAFSIMGWVKPESLVVDQMIVGDTSDTNSDGIKIDATTGKISITIGGTNTVLSTSGLSVGAWQHVAVVRTVTTNALVVYINGVNSTNGSPTQAGTFGIKAIGATHSTPAKFANSAMSDIKIFSTTLTQSQVRSIISGTDYVIGLVARWKFNESAKSVPSCHDGYSLEFDGVDDRISMTNQDLSSAFTISGWIKPDSFATSQILIGDISDVNSDGIQIDATTGKVSITIGGANTVLSTTSLKLGQWQHITVSRTAATNALLVYIDGENKTSGSPTQAGAFGINSIGSTNSTPEKFVNGNIDDIRVYNTKLSAADIAILATGNEASTAPISNWAFDDGPQYGDPSNGDPISIWESRDSNRYVFSQPTLTLCPTYLQSGKNTRPGIRFNGTSQFLERAGHVLGDTEGDIIIVATPSGLLSNDTMYSQSDRYTNNSLELKTYQGRESILSSGISGGLGNTILTPATTYVSKFTSDGLVSYIDLNAAAQTITASGAGNVGTWFGDLVVGSGSLTTIGSTIRTGFTGNYWEGDIYEIIAINKEKTTTKQVDKIESSTIKKYGV